MADRPGTVDEYLAAAADVAQPHLTVLRQLCREVAPDATEGLKWGSPAYWTGTILFVFSGHRAHANLVVTPSAMADFRAEIEELGFGTGKGSVHLPYDRQLPTELLARMLAYRVREYAADGVTWM